MLIITFGFAVLPSRTVVIVSFLVRHAVISHPTLPHPHLPRLSVLPLLPLDGCQYLVNSGQFCCVQIGHLQVQVCHLLIVLLQGFLIEGFLLHQLALI